MDTMIGSFEGRRQYVAGERVSCFVQLRSPDEVINNPDVDQVILHAVAVQLVGIFSYNAQWCAPPYVAPPKKEKKKQLFPPLLPQLAKNERFLFYSPAVIAGEHIIMEPKQSYNFSFSELLPKEIPPSFRGAVGSYSYRIVVAYYKVPPSGIIKIGSDTYRTVSHNVNVVSPISMARCVRSTIEDVPFDPVVERSEKITVDVSKDSIRKDVQEALFAPAFDVQKRYSQQICVNVMDNTAFILRLVLPRTVLLPGQTLYWMCDFRGSDVLCQALEVHIATEETVDPAIAYSKNVLKVGTDVYGGQSCNCSCLDLVPLSIGIPKDVVPEFTTKLTSLKWALVFKFHTVPKPARAGIELTEAKIVNFTFPIHVISLPE